MSRSWYSFTDEEIARVRSETFVRQVEQFAELPSTNNYALDLVKHASPGIPLLVLAEQQTAGRGRGVNRWWSIPGSLTFSLVIDIEEFGLKPKDYPQISLVSALALAASLRDAFSICEPQLKWPNDLYLSSRKVAGLLLEPAPGIPNLVVVGVGINVNCSMADATEEIRSVATSMYDESQKRFGLSDLMMRVVHQLASHYVQLGRGELPIKEHWKRSCMLAGRIVRLRVGLQSIRGLCQSVDDEGGLLLQTDAGLRRFFSGTIEQIG